MSMNLSIKHASELELARFARDGINTDALIGFGDSGFSLLLEEVGSHSRAAQSAGGDIGNSATWAVTKELLSTDWDRISSTFSRRVRPMRGAVGLGAVLHLEKSWHILHYLYTGQAWGGAMPAATLLEGGREVGDDLGYGPARAVSVADTAAFAAFLADIPVMSLLTRIDIRAMHDNEVHCVDDIDIATGTEVAVDVAQFAPRLAAHVEDAANRGQGLLIWMV